MKTTNKILSKLFGSYKVENSLVHFDNGTGYYEPVGYHTLPIILLNRLPTSVTATMLVTGNEELKAAGVTSRFVVTRDLFDRLLEAEDGYARERLFELPILERDYCLPKFDEGDRSYLFEGYDYP